MSSDIRSVVKLTMIIVSLISYINLAAATAHPTIVQCNQDIPGVLKQVFNIGGAVESVAFGPNGELVVLELSMTCNNLHVISTSATNSDRHKFCTIPLSETPDFITAHPNGICIVRNDPRLLKILNLSNQSINDTQTLSDNPYGSICSGTAKPCSLAFCPNEKSIAIGTANDGLYLEENCECISPTSKIIDNGVVLSTVFSPDGKFIVSAVRKNDSPDTCLIFWNAKTWDIEKTVLLEGVESDNYTTMSISPDCSFVVIGYTPENARNGIIELRDAYTGLCLHKFELTECGQGNYITAIAINQAVTEIAICMHTGTVIVLADALTDTMRYKCVLALACAQHPTPGENSPARSLSSNTLQNIHDKFIPTPWKRLGGNADRN